MRYGIIEKVSLTVFVGFCVVMSLLIDGPENNDKIYNVVYSIQHRADSIEHMRPARVIKNSSGKIIAMSYIVTLYNKEELLYYEKVDRPRMVYPQ